MKRMVIVVFLVLVHGELKFTEGGVRQEVS